MKALLLRQPRDFAIVDVPMPDLSAASGAQLLVRAKWVSMCGSDIPKFAGGKGQLRYPLDPGAPIHECVGVVADTTSKRFHVGDLVVAKPDGERGLAEHFIAHATRAVRLPADLGDCDSCSLIQPLSTVINALDRVGPIKGRSFGVVGLGSIGLFFVWLLKQRGASEVIGIDPVDSRCRLAQELGARQTYSMRAVEVVHQVREVPSPWTAPQVCIEAVGHQMDTVNDCLELV